MAEAISTLKLTMQKVFTGNSVATGTSIVGPAPTTTDPINNAGVISWPTTSGTNQNSESFELNTGPNQYKFVFYGVGNANTTGIARITKWDFSGSVWIPTPLITVALTLGAATGVSGSSPADTEKFIDTIVKSADYGFSSYQIISPADDTVAELWLDPGGARRIQVQTALNNSSTSLNCLVGGF